MDTEDRIYELKTEIHRMSDDLSDANVKHHRLSDRIEELYNIRSQTMSFVNESLEEWQDEIPQTISYANEEFEQSVNEAIAYTEQQLEETKRDMQTLEREIEDKEWEARRLQEM